MVRFSCQLSDIYASPVVSATKTKSQDNVTEVMGMVKKSRKKTSASFPWTRMRSTSGSVGITKRVLESMVPVAKHFYPKMPKKGPQMS